MTPSETSPGDAIAKPYSLDRLRSTGPESAITAPAGTITADAPTREDTERRQTIWWYLLALAGVLLATETLMSNKLSRRSAL